jgi:endonuclease G
MKLLLALVLTFVIFFSRTNTLRKDVYVKTDVYSVHYSEVYEQPTSISYTVACTETKFSRTGLDFYTCDSIHTSDNNDYANNDYDKGHMAPAADFACDQNKLDGTFSYLNCTLQNSKLNRGVWKSLETHERKLALSSKTAVSIKIHFSKTSKKLTTGATVPDGFTKVIKSGGITEKYYFPNIVPIKKTYNEYKK